MNTLSTWILTVLLSIAPPQKISPHTKESVDAMKARYEAIAQDMSSVIEKSKPLFKGKDAELRTAALLTSIAFYESGFRKDVDDGRARGDNGRSWCLMQINIGNGHVIVGDAEMKSWTGKDLVKDRKKCFAVGLETIRLSLNQCSSLSGAGVLSAYTTGKCIPNERSSANRWNFSQTILDKHPALIEDTKKAEFVSDVK